MHKIQRPRRPRVSGVYYNSHYIYNKPRFENKTVLKISPHVLTKSLDKPRLTLSKLFNIFFSKKISISFQVFVSIFFLSGKLLNDIFI